MNHFISRSSRSSRIAGVCAAIVLVVLAAAPWWGSSGMMQLIGQFMVYLALASLWNLLRAMPGWFPWVSRPMSALAAMCCFR